MSTFTVLTSRAVSRLMLSGLLLAVILALGSCNHSTSPQLIVHNANVLTVNAETPTAQAFAIRDGKFIYVGNDTTILALAGAGTEVIDAQGQTIVPGFNDAHLHALAIPTGAVDLSDASTLDELVAMLAHRGQTTQPNAWIIGYGYDDTVLGRHLTRRDLDLISTDHPVLAIHASLHLYATNSTALSVAGITSETMDPEDGRFYRNDAGDPTGLLSERSALEALFVDGQPSILPNDLDSAVRGLQTFFQIALRNGITSYGDALVPPELALTYWWADPESAGVRVNLMFDVDDLDTVALIKNIDHVLSWIGLNLFDTHWLQAKTIKIFHGHSLSGRTTRLFEPYADRPNYFGEEPQHTQDELNALITEVHRQGFQAAVHANGDFEIDMVIRAIERAVTSSPRDHRHRLEHASVTNDDILDRIAALNIVVAPHSYIYEKGSMIEAYGEARWPYMFANASIMDRGIPNAANSDFPVSALNPLLRIQSLTTRTSRNGKTYGPSQKLTVEQALYAYTMGGAIASFEEAQKGSISTGKYADFVILSDDPRTVSPVEIMNISVEATYTAGLLRFER